MFSHFHVSPPSRSLTALRLHPYLIQQELKDYCDKKGIVLTAYAPTGYDIVRSDPTISELAAKYGVSPTQIVLAWHVARGVSAVPKSANPQRQKDNITVRGFRFYVWLVVKGADGC